MGILLFVTVGRYLEAAARARTTDALAALVRQMPGGRAPPAATDARSASRSRALAPGDRVRVRPGERLPVDGVVVEGEAQRLRGRDHRRVAPAAARPGDAVVRGHPQPRRQPASSRCGARARRRPSRGSCGWSRRRAPGGYPFAPLVDRSGARLRAPGARSSPSPPSSTGRARRDAATGLMNALARAAHRLPLRHRHRHAARLHGRRRSRRRRRRPRALGRGLRAPRPHAAASSSTRPAPSPRGVPALVEAAPGPRRDRGRAARASPPASRRTRSTRSPRRPRGGRGARAIAPARRSPTSARVAGAGRRGPARAAASCAWAGADFVGDAPHVAEPGASIVHLSRDGAWLGALVFRDRPARPRPRRSPRAPRAGPRGRGPLRGPARRRWPRSPAACPASSPRPSSCPRPSSSASNEAIRRGESPVMVGDGINDAPALSGAAVGVTLESGTDLAREVADVTILGGDLRRLPWLFGLARRTLRTARLQPLLGLLLQRDRPRPRGAGPAPPALRRGRHGRLQPARRPPLPARSRATRCPRARPLPAHLSQETSDDPSWLVAAGLTLAGSIHCVGMCGGFVLAVAAGRRGAWRLVGHQVLLQLGKATTYAFLGALAGRLRLRRPRQARSSPGASASWPSSPPSPSARPA